MPYDFTYTRDDGTVFEAPLEQFQCGHVNPTTNARCKRKGYKGFERCWQHMRSDYHVAIKKSLIPGAGYGLFAFCPGAPGQVCFQPKNGRVDRIVAYNGEILSKKEVDERYGGDTNTAPYVIEDNSNRYEDGALRRTIAASANAPLKGTRPNAKLYTVNRTNGALGATKIIRSGDEILTSYGPAYRFDSVYSTKYRRP